MPRRSETTRRGFFAFAREKEGIAAMVELEAGKGKRLEAYVKKCRTQLEAKGWEDGLSYAAQMFLESVWGPMFEFNFRYLHCGCPLEGRKEVGYVQYFTYLRRGRRPVVFEVLTHYASNLRLTVEEYETFAEHSEALDSLGYVTIRVTDVELDFARRYVSDRVSSALEFSERYVCEREWAM